MSISSMGKQPKKHQKIKPQKNITENNQGKTTLHIAAQTGDLEGVKQLLLHKKININSSDTYGKRALHYAAENGHEEILNALLQHKKIDVNSQDVYGKTALHYAAENGHEGIIKKLLVVEKIDINAQNDPGKTVLHIAAEKGHEEILNILLQHEKIDVNSQDIYGKAALHIAAEKGHEEILNALLQHEKIDVNILDNNRNTPLNYAATTNNIKIVTDLIDNGADVTIKNKNDKKPSDVPLNKDIKNLIEEAEKEQVKVQPEVRPNVPPPLPPRESKPRGPSIKVKKQAPEVRQQAQQKLEPKVEQDPIKIDLKPSKEQESNKKIQEPAQEKPKQSRVNIKKASQKLKRSEKKLTTKKPKKNEATKTPTSMSIPLAKDDLRQATMKGNVERIKELVEGDMNPQQKIDMVNKQYGGNFTVLHYAVQRNDTNSLKVLLNVEGIDVNQQEGHGYTPLHLASRNGNQEIVNLLLENGADVSIQDNYKKTAWDLAKNQEIKNLIKEKASEVQQKPDLKSALKKSSGDKSNKTVKFSDEPAKDEEGREVQYKGKLDPDYKKSRDDFLKPLEIKQELKDKEKGLLARFNQGKIKQKLEQANDQYKESAQDGVKGHKPNKPEKRSKKESPLKEYNSANVDPKLLQQVKETLYNKLSDLGLNKGAFGDFKDNFNKLLEGANKQFESDNFTQSLGSTAQQLNFGSINENKEILREAVKIYAAYAGNKSYSSLFNSENSFESKEIAAKEEIKDQLTEDKQKIFKLMSKIGIDGEVQGNIQKSYESLLSNLDKLEYKASTAGTDLKNIYKQIEDSCLKISKQEQIKDPNLLEEYKQLDERLETELNLSKNQKYKRKNLTLDDLEKIEKFNSQKSENKAQSNNEQLNNMYKLDAQVKSSFYSALAVIQDHGYSKSIARQKSDEIGAKELDKEIKIAQDQPKDNMQLVGEKFEENIKNLDITRVKELLSKKEQSENVQVGVAPEAKKEQLNSGPGVDELDSFLNDLDKKNKQNKAAKEAKPKPDQGFDVNAQIKVTSEVKKPKVDKGLNEQPNIYKDLYQLAADKYNIEGVKSFVNVGYIADLLKANDRDINTKDKEGNTLLHLAAENGHTEFVGELLRVQGIRLDEQNKNGETALYLAAEQANIDIFEKLLGNGANVNIPNNENKTIFDVTENKRIRELIADKSKEQQLQKVVREEDVVKEPKSPKANEIKQFVKNLNNIIKDAKGLNEEGKSYLLSSIDELITEKIINDKLISSQTYTQTHKREVLTTMNDIIASIGGIGNVEKKDIKNLQKELNRELDKFKKESIKETKISQTKKKQPKINQEANQVNIENGQLPAQHPVPKEEFVEIDPGLDKKLFIGSLTKSQSKLKNNYNYNKIQEVIDEVNRVKGDFSQLETQEEIAKIVLNQPSETVKKIAFKSDLFKESNTGKPKEYWSVINQIDKSIEKIQLERDKSQSKELPKPENNKSFLRQTFDAIKTIAKDAFGQGEKLPTAPSKDKDLLVALKNFRRDLEEVKTKDDIKQKFNEHTKEIKNDITKEIYSSLGTSSKRYYAQATKSESKKLDKLEKVVEGSEFKGIKETLKKASNKVSNSSAGAAVVNKIVPKKNAPGR